VKELMSALYASMEQLELEDPKPTYDIWSIGIILYVLMQKKEPYKQFSVVKRIKAIQENQRDNLPDFYS
jgi:serine/threonine protein kinase